MAAMRLGAHDIKKTEDHLMEKQNRTAIFLTGAFVAFIFFNSLTPSDISDVGSLSIVDFLQEIIDSLSIDFTVTNKIVRKTAHFVEYAVLGVLLALTAALSGGDRKMAFALAVLAAIVVPIADENIQRLVPGRTYFFSDILIDIAGGATGFLLVIVKKGLYFRKSRMLGFILAAAFGLCFVANAEAKNFVGEIHGDEPPVKLLKIFVKKFSPERAKIIVDREYTPQDESFGRVTIFIWGGRYHEYRFDYAAADLIFVKCNPASEWTDEFASLKIPKSDFMRGNIEIRLLESDINEAVARYYEAEAAKKPLPWSGIRVKIEDDVVGVIGKFSFLSGLFSGSFEARSGIKITDGTKFNLVGAKLFINGAESTIIGNQIQKYANVFDIADIAPEYNFRLRRVTFKNGIAAISSQIRPYEWGGIEYSYAAK